MHQLRPIALLYCVAKLLTARLLWLRICARIALRLLRQVEERRDLPCLGSELDRKVDESFDLERRGGEVNHSISPGPDVPVLAAAVIREDDPLVLAPPQIVLDELLNQLV